ncbi:hypothetical protein J4P02_26090 [Pseudomonas sp. NFXW11]|uniref:hypothetical protein n=1 Tax=Pseudomonas sp. NFXW11 TaxID=2819531 RepID=UPI003CF9EE2E
MTAPVQPAVEDAPSVDPLTEAHIEDKAAIPAFKFPFKPSEFAAAKNAQQTWYKKGVGDGHTKTPGAAPPGTRRSMGKR